MIPALSGLALPSEYVEYYNKTWRLVYVSDKDRETDETNRPIVLDDLRLFFWSNGDDTGNVIAGSEIVEYTVKHNGIGTVTIEGSVPYDEDYYDLICSGYADGVDALIQTIFIILSTERYKFPIYSFDYGIELVDLFGKPMSFAVAELPRRITEALTYDNRISGCKDFRFFINKEKLLVKFIVQTIYGRVHAEMGVVV